MRSERNPLLECIVPRQSGPGQSGALKGLGFQPRRKSRKINLRLQPRGEHCRCRSKFFSKLFSR
jgi:hypothetical protein